MKDLGMDAYRFSISWPRIFPSKSKSVPEFVLHVLYHLWLSLTALEFLLIDGTGEPNAEGINYYNSFIDALLEKGCSEIIILIEIHFYMKVYIHRCYCLSKLFLSNLFLKFGQYWAIIPSEILLA